MKHVLVYMTLSVMLVSSCSSKKNKGEELKLSIAEQKAFQPELASLEAEQSYSDTTTRSYAESVTPRKRSTTSEHIDWDKKIIKKAEITLELTDYKAYDRKLHTGLKAYGAYIANEEENHSTERLSNDISIKVPVEQFENLVGAFGGDGVTVVQKKISTDDVTGELIDTRSRMEAKKQVRDRYLQLLNQARNMKEILSVQQEINSIQEEIESAAGRVSYLGNQAAYSTIHLQYFQVTGVTSPPVNNGFQLKLEQAFNSGVHFIGNGLLLLVTIWPLLIFAFIAFLMLRRRGGKVGLVREVKQG